MGTAGTTLHASPMETSWWLDQALAGEAATTAAEAPPVEGESHADVCIVGGGYAGLWTALTLKQRAPTLDVAIVERDVCGSGASGRNGGFALTMWHHIGSLTGICGTDDALWIGRASEDAVDEIGRFCAAHGIDADYRRRGWLWTATNASQVGAWSSTERALERHGIVPFRGLDGDDARRRSGSPWPQAATYEATAATVQPAKLARGLRRVALEHGVRIHEHSPMVALERTRTPAVRTPGGRITADRIVLCLNAWTAGVRRMDRAFAIVGSDVVVTQPARAELDRLGVEPGLAVSDSRMMVHYHHRTADDRIVFGKGGLGLAYGTRADFGTAPARSATVAGRLTTAYPTLAHVPIAGRWAGPIDRTVDGLPFFTTLGRPDIVCGAGFSGNGVAPTLLGGRILASLALGADDDWARCGLVRRPPSGIPPEPLRSLGGRLVQAAVARKEHAEDAGRRPRRAARWMAGLAPTGLIPLD